MSAHDRTAAAAAARPGAHAGYFLVGPTAVGKTAVAQYLAETHGFELLSADSMLVYAGMDIGTAKPSAAARARVRCHGMDLTTPDKPFSVGTYLGCVRLSLAEAGEAGGAAGAAGERRILVAGGTGLYVKALLCGLAALPPANPSVRAYWNDVLEEQGVEALQAALRQRSPGLLAALPDPRNARRLIRALELAEAGVTRPPRTWPARAAAAPLCGLRMPPEALAARIETRVREMYAGGLVEEVRGLLARYPTLSETALQAIGYAEATDLLAGRCSEAEAMARTLVRTRQLAKHQRTWFAHQLPVKWIDVAASADLAQIAGRVLNHWREHGPVPIAV